MVLKMLFNTLLCLRLKKQSHLSRKFKESLKKTLFCSSFYHMFALHEFKLINKYSTILLD